MSTAAATINTSALTASLGRPVVLAYGRHLVGGNVIFMDQSDPAFTFMLVALGEGPWDSIESLNVNGLDIDLSTATMFHLHKGLDGELSTTADLAPEGTGSPYPFSADGDQKADAFIPVAYQGLTFSRTAILALKVPFDQNAPAATPSVIGIYHTRKVRRFHSSDGGLTWVLLDAIFSDNPAWQIADLLTTVRGLPDSRIDWASFDAAATYCAQTLSINGNDYARFVCNMAFTQSVSLDQALQAMLATCRGCLLDTEGTIKLRIDQTRSSVFDFTMDNILEGSFSAYYQDTRAAANQLEFIFRDTENKFATMDLLWNHEPQQARTGRIVNAKIDLGCVPQNQAQRVGDYLLTRAIDNNLYCKLKGDKSSLAVMPGDVVRVWHAIAPWAQAAGAGDEFKSFEVIEAVENPDETRDFTLQVYNAASYPDTAGPTQNLTDSNLTRSASVSGAPPAPDSWNLSANLGGDLRLAFSIPAGADYRTGDLWLASDDEINRVETTLAADAQHTDPTVQVGSVSGLLVGDYINYGGEILKITGPGTVGTPPSSSTMDVDHDQLLSGGSIVDTAPTGTPVYRIRPFVCHFLLPPNWALSHPTINLADSDQYYVVRFRPGRQRILYANFTLNNGIGISPALEASFSALGAYEPDVAGTLPGLRASDGLLATIQVPGPVGPGSDVAALLIPPHSTSWGPIFAAIGQGPIGADITAKLQIDDGAGGWADWGPTFTIPATSDGSPSGSGVFASGAQQGDVGARMFRLVILTVGGTSPGSNLIVYLPF